MGKQIRVPTIKKSALFQQVFRQGKAWHTPAFVCFYHPAEVDEVGYVASKKVGKAVERNRAKRRLRALFCQRPSGELTGRFVLVAKRPILTFEFDHLSELFIRAIKQLTSMEKRKKV